jgi:signal transduction histidine kinase
MRIRSRLMLLLIVPLVGLLAVTGFQVVQAIQQSREAARLSDGAELAQASYRLIDALQAERALLATDQPVTKATRAAVTAASADVKSKADAEGGALQELTDRALSRVDAASSLAATDTGGIVAVDGYTPAITDLLLVSKAGFDPGDAINDAPSSAADFLATAQEAAAHERDLIAALSADQALGNTQFQKVTSLASEQQILSAEAADVAEPDLQVRIDRIGDVLAAAALGRDELFFSGTVDQASVDTWLAGADTRVEALRSLRDDAGNRAVAAVDDLASSSRRVLILSSLAALATLLISGLLVRSATRSIARPLQDLAAQAEEVALSRLPDAVRAQQNETAEVHLPAVRATGAAEVREVAGAFNDVQDTALRLAGEQAVLRRNLADALTNLGRRNQALLGRQLDFISSLEKRETDPAFLDHLFRLDHLASRMRRNAESLLILAGSETPRRRRKPAEMAEVVRASMSEVEDFERVRLGHLGRATLAGPVVIDLVHLLAELIENALGFSPPDTTVEIDGRSLGQGGYQLAVIDHGVGMSDVELVAANHRLAGLDEVDGMPTRYLGQYVIAKLAAKVGALVRLQPTVGGRGVTAVVSLPATGMIGAADRSSIAQPLPGSRAARDQGPVPFAPGAGISAAADQPEPVIDPEADPFAEPVPALDPTASTAVPDTPDWLESSSLGDASWAAAGAPSGDHAVDLFAVDEPSWSDGADGPVADWGLTAGATADPAALDVPPLDVPTLDVPALDVPALDEPALDVPALDVPALDVPALDEPMFDEAGPAGPDLADGSPGPAGDDILWPAPEVEQDDTESGTEADPTGGPGWFAPSDSTGGGERSTLWSAPTGPATPADGSPVAEPPPPPPAAVPHQDWFAGAGAATVADALTMPPPPVFAPAPGTLPEPAPPEPALPEQPLTASIGAGLVGGLAKRVPGASLSESPLAEQQTVVAPDRDRSADGVRSMLSSFQSGRHRGLDGSVAVDDPVTAGTGPVDARGAMEQMDAEPASELEDPK